MKTHDLEKRRSENRAAKALRLDGRGSPSISPDEAFPILSQFEVVDVRDSAEFRGPVGHIRGARSLPLREIAARLDELSGGRQLLLVSETGRRASMAADLLQRATDLRVRSLEGGLIAWCKAGLPLERDFYSSSDEVLRAICGWYHRTSGKSATRARATVIGKLIALGAAPENPTGPELTELVTSLADRLNRSEEPPRSLALSVEAFRDAIAELELAA